MFFFVVVVFCRVPWHQERPSLVPWCHMVQAWHHNPFKTQIVYLYWRNSSGSSSNSNRRNKHNRPMQVQYMTHDHFCIPLEMWNSLVKQTTNMGNIDAFSTCGYRSSEFWEEKLFSRPSRNIGADSSALPFSGSHRFNDHSASREHPPVQHSSDPHDPHHTSHTSLRELWNCATATVCFNIKRMH